MSGQDSTYNLSGVTAFGGATNSALKLAVRGGTSQTTVVYGELGNTAASSYGVWGTTLNNTSTSSAGVYGSGSAGSGVLGQVSQNGGVAVRGINNGGGTTFARGVFGSILSTGGTGVMGSAATSPTFTAFPGPSAPTSANTTTAGVLGIASGSTSAGVYGFAGSGGTGAVGIDGTATGSGSAGVRGVTANANGLGVIGISDAAGGGATAIQGTANSSTTGIGVLGQATSATSTGASYGVRGTTVSTLNWGSSAALPAAGVYGSATSVGVLGTSTVTTNGSSSSGRVGAGGISGYTSNANGNAGYFLGRVVIENTFAAGAATNDQGNGSPDALIVWTNSGASGFNRSGAMFSPSDRNSKTGFTQVDSLDVLNALVKTPVTRWHYKGDDKTWYMGPMAQDFMSSFGLGDKDTVIHGVNADGVALAAIQGLNSKLESELKTRDAQIAELQKQMAEMQSVLKQAKLSPNAAGIGMGVVLLGIPAVLGIAYLRRRVAR